VATIIHFAAQNHDAALGQIYATSAQRLLARGHRKEASHRCTQCTQIKSEEKVDGKNVDGVFCYHGLPAELRNFSFLIRVIMYICGFHEFFRAPAPARP